MAVRGTGSAAMAKQLSSQRGAMAQEAAVDRILTGDAGQYSELQAAVVSILAAIVDDDISEEDAKKLLAKEVAIEMPSVPQPGQQRRAESRVERSMSVGAHFRTKAAEEENDGCVAEYWAVFEKNYRANKRPFWIGSGFLVWFFLMTLFYRFGVEMTWAQSFFFTVDTGMSVGFGSPGITCEEQDQPTMHFSSLVCELVTVFHMLLVALWFTVLLGTLASVVVVSNSDNVKKTMKKQKKRKEAQTLQKKLEGAGVVRKPKTADKGPKPSVLAKAWAWVRVPVIKFAILYVVWLVVGILYGIYIEEWSWSKSMLFAVSATSTAGLIAPTTGDTAMVLTMFYTLIGVFLFATFLGYLGDLVLQSIQKSLFAERAGLSAGAQDRLKAQMIQHRAKVDFPTFFEFTLLKENMVTDDQVKSIKKSWEMMNADGDAYISLDELYCAELFDMADEDGSGDLELDEIFALGELIDRKMAGDMGLDSLEDEMQDRIRKYVEDKAEAKFERVEKRKSLKAKPDPKKKTVVTTKEELDALPDRIRSRILQVIGSTGKTIAEASLHLRRVGSLSDSDDIMDKKEFIKFFTDALRAILDKAGDGMVDKNMQQATRAANLITTTDFEALGSARAASPTGSTNEESAFGFGNEN